MTIDTIFWKVTFNFFQLFLDFDGKQEHSKQILRFRKVKYLAKIFSADRFQPSIFIDERDSVPVSVLLKFIVTA